MKEQILNMHIFNIHNKLDFHTIYLESNATNSKRN